MVEIAEDTDSIVEMVVGYLSIVTAYPVVVVPTFVVANREARDTPAMAVATAADSTWEVVVDATAREAGVVVVETYYKFLSTKKYTVAYYTSNT